MSTLFRLILWWVFRVPSVVLEDHDGEVNVRRVRWASRFPTAGRFGMGIARVRLLPGGAVRGVNYVKAWHPFVPLNRDWYPEIEVKP